MKKVLISALILQFLVILGSCNSVNKRVAFDPRLDTKKKCTISIVGYLEEFEVLYLIEEDFKFYYPNVEISYTCLKNYTNDVKNRFSTGKEIDIFLNPDFEFTGLESNIFFENSLDLNSLNIDFTYFNRSYLSYFSKDEKLYSLPLFPENYGMMVNKDIFLSCGLSVPANITELFDAMDTLYSNGYSSPILAQQKYYGLNFMPVYIELINSGSSAEEAFSEAISYAHNFMWIGGLNSDSFSLSEDPRDLINRFFKGDIPIALISLSDFSLTSKIKLENPDYKSNRFDYFYAASPFGFYSKDAYMQKNGFVSLNVFKDSCNLDYTCEFIRFISKEDNIKKINKNFTSCGVLYEKEKSDFDYFNSLKKKYVMDDSGVQEYLGIAGLGAFKYSEDWNKTSWVEFKKAKKRYLE